MNRLCEMPTKEPAPLSDAGGVNIFHVTTSTAVRAARCTMRVSRFVLYCGASSHMKLMYPPDILAPEEITSQNCREMWDRKGYILPDGRIIPVNLNAETSFSYLSHGTLEYSTSNVYCTGATIMLRGEQHMQVLEYLTINLEVDEVTLEIEGDTVIDTDHHVTLPPECGQQDCNTGADAYVLIDRPLRCPLKRIRTLSMQEITLETKSGKKPFLLDDQHEIILEERRTDGALIALCPQVGDIKETQFKEIRIVRGPGDRQVPWAEGVDVNIDLELRMTAEYLSYQTESMLQKELELVRGTFCRLQTHTLQKVEKSPFHRAAMIRVRGQVVQEYFCQEEEVTLREGQDTGPDCYEDAIPVNVNGEVKYYEISTHLLLNQIDVDRTACQDRFPS